MSLSKILDRIGLVFDGEVGLYVHKNTQIPLTVHYDEEREEIVLLDQTKLPYEVTTWRSKDWKEVATLGIKGMIVRGSQAIGCVAAYAALLLANSLRARSKEGFLKDFNEGLSFVRSARPTAYPLMWALDLVREAVNKASAESTVEDLISIVKRVADHVLASDLVMCWFLRQEGKKFLADGDVVMTHCNGGSLSSSFGGHALGMIEEAYAEGLDLTLVAKETRPRCQGYKLTVWEINRAGVPVIIVTDNMISSAFDRYGVTKVILGVDRVAKDGSVANKIGSADIAYIARVYGIPFYYATSYSTIDLDTERGSDIPIEERDKDEITYFYRLEAEDLRRRGLTSNKALCEWPKSDLISKTSEPGRGEIAIYNPAFDVTPPELITQIITDIGSFKPTDISKLTETEIAERVKSRLDEWSVTLGFNPNLGKQSR